MRSPLLACVFALLLVSGAQARPPAERPAGAVDRAVADDRPRLESTGSSRLAKAVLDSLYLYGGPGSPEGRFQDADGLPDWQGWTGHDPSDRQPLWHPSTFNAENLNSNGPANTAMWCGIEDLREETRDWATPPGYGNGWFAILDFELSYPGDPAQEQIVDLDFFFNLDLETGYDYLQVYYDSAGSWTKVWELDGSNQLPDGSYPAPGLRYGAQPGRRPIVFMGNDYGGAEGDQIGLRIVVNSDGAWSDEDGLWPTEAGAAQVDDISVSYFDGAEHRFLFEHFEGEPPYLWMGERACFKGDFTKLYMDLTDLDPCHENRTPQLTFIDDGTPCANPDCLPWMTLGSTSSNWSYGTPEGWVVQYDGGWCWDGEPLVNEGWSPPILFDLPGSADDDLYGLLIRFDLWRHLPLTNGIFWVWGIRSSSDGGNSWGWWEGDDLVNYGNEPAYLSYEIQAGHLLPSDATHVQLRLSYGDYADDYMFPGNDATPSPWYDNVALIKYGPVGARIAMSAMTLLQDGFPASGSLDLEDLPGLAVRLDPPGVVFDDGAGGLVPRDSMVADVRPPNRDLALSGRPKLHFRLLANPAFDTVREIPAGVTSIGVDPAGWTIYEGSVVGASLAAEDLPDRYSFDLPGDGPARGAFEPDEERFFFPGDELHWYVEASDVLGHVSTLPADLSGYGERGAFDRSATVHGLPSLRKNGEQWEQPPILLVDDAGNEGDRELWLRAFAENGLVEQVDFDVYSVRGPEYGLSNGIGAAGAHGATLAQLAGYRTLLYSSGDLRSRLLSDGSGSGLHDGGADLPLLDGWHHLEGDRRAAWFGDALARWLVQNGSVAQAYLADVMAVEYVGGELASQVGDQPSPSVGGTDPARFAHEFAVVAGCPEPRAIDVVLPAAGKPALRMHEFLSLWGESGLYTPVASVWHERSEDVGGTLFSRIDLSFPFALEAVQDAREPTGDGRSSRSVLLGEILAAFDHPLGVPVSNESLPTKLVVGSVVPNPFNPVATLRLSLPAAGPLKAVLYDLRGKRVRVLHDAVAGPGPLLLRWDGRDARGRSVASGVYLLKVEGFGLQETRKLALVR